MKGQNIIIKRKKKGGHGGAHGGSWKVAYADFVTAMMAFFLLMWLLNMTSASKKLQLSTYFKNLSMFSAISMYFIGHGKDIVESNVTSSPREVNETVENASPQDDTDVEKLKELLEELKKQMKATEEKLKAAANAEELKKLEQIKENLKKEMGNVEEKIKDATSPNGPAIEAEKFKEKLKRDIGELLKKEIGEKGAGIKDQVLIDVIEGGIRIQIIDKTGEPMFALGSPELTTNAKRIMKVIAKDVLILRDIKISIEGHTDALGYSSTKYTNWELSTDRASAARRELEQNGIDPGTLSRVAGFASTEPLIKNNPDDPRNRRITLMIYSTNAANLQSDVVKKNVKAAPAKGDNASAQAELLRKIKAAATGANAANSTSNAQGDQLEKSVKAAVGNNEHANIKVEPVDLLKGKSAGSGNKEGKQ
ncbi:MAG: OmpA family protein [Candidatus Magnetominusculus sp. LBB02]|nr:OmpA family protein [Candidatus Magnetominusculus sp. LBB02]